MCVRVAVDYRISITLSYGHIIIGSKSGVASHSPSSAISVDILVDSNLHCSSSIVHDDLLQIQNLISLKVRSLNEKQIPKHLQTPLSTVAQSSRLFSPTQLS